MNEIEIRTKRGDAVTPTARRVFLNGDELPGVHDIHVVNRAGETIDFLEVSVTFFVRESNLKVIDEFPAGHSQ